MPTTFRKAFKSIELFGGCDTFCQSFACHELPAEGQIVYSSKEGRTNAELVVSKFAPVLGALLINIKHEFKNSGVTNKYPIFENKKYFLRKVKIKKIKFQLGYYDEEDEQEDDSWETGSTESWETIVEEVAYG